MDQKDRLAYEVAMAALRDTREDCLRWLDDQPPAETPRTPARWWSFGQTSMPSHRRLAS